MQEQHNEYYQLAHSALAGAIWDDKLKKLASYKELVNHRNSIIRDKWTKGGENEFGRPFQGFLPNGINGLDVLEWIKKNQVPRDKTVTYSRYTASLRPEKVDEPHRARITVGGNFLEYDGDITTHTVSMERIKAH